MTEKERAARRAGVPEEVIMVLRPEFECDEEVRESAKRAKRSGDKSRWGY